jgi:F-type H+-transporting ATPase subunit a
VKGPLETTVVFEVGPVLITRTVVTTWGIAVLLALVFAVGTRRMKPRPTRVQALLELVVVGISRQIEDIIGRDPKPFFPLLGSLFIFLVVGNIASVAPGVYSPTATLETAAALAFVVFVAVRYYGIRLSGLRGHLRSLARPSLLALPLNIIGEFTRTFALMVRLFGNIMSGQFLVGLIVALAGLLVPVPLMVLGIIIGLVQAYIFTVLAAVFIAAGIGAIESREEEA